jgi:serine/threonine protein kinase/Tol biopolymer transport system component
MPLQPGTRLGGYQIIAMVGAGGMGEVYRARDTRLRRDVALKLLPERLATSADALARFEREAQAVAALSHPNILAVHDFGRADAHAFVVFELLDGGTLRERLTSGPVPLRKAIDYARQVADGLAAAHARGITHRDIKPDNIFVTHDGRVKILDFGLAHTTPPMAVADVGTEATLTQPPLTDAGTILGTVGYQAPEQVRGQTVDARADLFALGAVLFEMCTGLRAFKGATPADTMAAVLASDPPEFMIAGKPPPPALERIVRRCLEKAPAERFQTARDLSFALDALSSISGSTRDVPDVPRRVSRGWLVAAAVVTALAVGALAGHLLWTSDAPAAAAAPPLRAEFVTSTSAIASLVISLSPDGRWLAHSAAVDGGGQRELVVRNLGTGESVSVPESVGGWGPSWSPRSDALMFATGRDIVRFTLGERTTSLVTSVGDGFRGLVWLDDDTIVYCSRVEGVRRVSLRSGEITTVVHDPDLDISAPSTIGTRTDYVLALRAQRAGAGARHVVVIRLADGQMTEVVPNEVAAAYAEPGHLLLPRPNGLFAAPFDPQRLVVTGEPVFFEEPILWDVGTGLSTLSTSRASVIAFLPGRAALLQFQWLNASGATVGRIEPSGMYGAFSLSPDGTRIAVRQLTTRGGRTTSAVRVIDVSRGVVSTLATPPGAISDPVWSADGSRVIYRRDATLISQGTYASTPEQLRAEVFYPDALSPDGRWLLGGVPRTVERGFGVFVLPADGRGDRQAVSDGPFASDEASFSPDGRWISYQSDVTGRHEVYVTPFPLTSERWQMSAHGGVQARWSSDGRALYYLDPNGQLMRVAVPLTGPRDAGPPEFLFDLGIGAPSSTLEQYAVHNDRFLVLRRAAEAPPQTIAVLGNWLGALQASTSQGSAAR